MPAFVNWLVSALKSDYVTYRFDDVMNHYRSSARLKIIENITIIFAVRPCFWSVGHLRTG